MLKIADREAIEFIENFNQATTLQLYKLFYKGMTFRGCQKRLATLTGKKYFKRIRNFITGEYTYFTDKLPSHADHNHYRNELYILLKQKYKVTFIPEYQLGPIKPDGYFEIEIRPKTFIMYFLEVQLSNSFEQKKYEDYYRSGAWKQITPIFPRVLIVGYKQFKLEPSNIRYQLTDLDFANLFDLIER